MSPERQRPRATPTIEGQATRLRRLALRFESVPGRQARHPHRNGIVAIGLLGISLLLAMTIGYSRELPFFGGGGPELQAEFASAANLRAGNPVRVRGVKVGKVKKVEHTNDLRAARVTIELDRKLELKADARASVAWRTLLGRNMYVDLDPGSPSARPLRGASIDRSRTTSQTEFDQLFEPLDETGRAGVRTTLTQFDAAFSDPSAPGRNINRLSPTMRTVAPALDALRGTRSGDLGRLTANTNRALGALGNSQRELAGLIDHADVTFGVTAARRADLGATLRATPGALREAGTTARRLRVTLDILDPVVERLRPGVRELDDAAAALRPSLREAVPVLRDVDVLAQRLSPALRVLRPASADAVTLIRRLDPTLTRATDTLLPWLAAGNDIGLRNIDSIGPTFSAIASAAQQFNGFGHQVRFQGMNGGERSIGLPCATFFADPTAAQRVQCESLDTILSGVFGAVPDPPRLKRGDR